jgi:hypothetical protein
MTQTIQQREPAAAAADDERLHEPRAEPSRTPWWRRETRIQPTHVLVAASVLLNLWVLRAQRLPTVYPNDSAFHLQMVQLARSSISHGQLPFAQWSPSLSLGSPLFVQYQSASAVLTALLSFVFGVQQSYAWSLYLLLALWPLCIWWTARLLNWGPWESALSATVAPLLFTITGRGFEAAAYTYMGSGLWSELWAMWTLPLAIGFSYRYVTRRQYLFGAVSMLAATIAFHFLLAYLAALVLGLLVVLTPREAPARLVRAAVAGGGALLASLWVTLPLLADARWTSYNEFQAGTYIDDSFGARKILRWLVEGKLFDVERFPVVTIFVGIGLVYCVVRFLRDERARLLVTGFVLSLLLYFGRPTFGTALNLLPGNKALLFQRFLAGVNLFGILLAGVGMVVAFRVVVATAQRLTADAGVEGGAPGAGVDRLARNRRLAGIGGFAAVGLVVLVLFPAWSQSYSYGEHNSAWINWQRGQDAAVLPSLDSLVAIARSRDDGRVYAGQPFQCGRPAPGTPPSCVAGQGGTLGNWGSNFLIGQSQVYNYLEDAGVQTVGQFLRTFSLMSNPEVYFDPANPGDYNLFGVRYVIAPAGLRLSVPATLVKTAGDFSLWTVGRPGFFDVVDTQGSITANASDLGKATAGFIVSSRAGGGVLPTIAFAGQPAAAPTLPPGVHPPGVAGTVVTQHDDLARGSASVVVDAHRRAVVLLKASFDPGWTATVDGRPAPTEMVAPALVGVAVPAGVHRVALQYHGDGSYPLLFGVALATLLAAAVGPTLWRRRRRTDAGAAGAPRPGGVGGRT